MLRFVVAPCSGACRSRALDLDLVPLRYRHGFDARMRAGRRSRRGESRSYGHLRATDDGGGTPLARWITVRTDNAWLTGIRCGERTMNLYCFDFFGGYLGSMDEHGNVFDSRGYNGRASVRAARSATSTDGHAAGSICRATSSPSRGSAGAISAAGSRSPSEASRAARRSGRASAHRRPRLSGRSAERLRSRYATVAHAEVVSVSAAPYGPFILPAAAHTARLRTRAACARR